jgi:hypothetical protein
VASAAVKTRARQKEMVDAEVAARRARGEEEVKPFVRSTDETQEAGGVVSEGSLPVKRKWTEQTGTTAGGIIKAMESEGWMKWDRAVVAEFVARLYRTDEQQRMTKRKARGGDGW